MEKTGGSERSNEMKLSLRNRFLIPTLALIVMGMGLSGVISYYKASGALQSAITKQIEQTSRTNADMLNAWVRDRKLDVTSWSRQQLLLTAAKDSFVGKAARKSANKLFLELKEDFGYYEDILLADTQGNILSASDESLVGTTSVADKSYFKEALKGSVFVSEVMKSKKLEMPIFGVSSPVMENDQIVGVIAGLVNIGVYNDRFIKNVKIGDSGYAYIFGKDGLVIAHPQKDEVMKLDMKIHNHGKKMMASEAGLISYSLKGVDKTVAFMKVKETGWTVAAEALNHEIMAPVKNLGIMNAIVCVTIVVLAAFVILFVVRSTVTPINRIVKSLTSGAEQVGASSEQVAASSQSLGEASSEQAASLQETTASLEEMSSMTQQNAAHAKQADGLMIETKAVVETAKDSMNRLMKAIAEITKASDDTSKIIKTIDEIAFQTNLLALNAAVEAARAGEAGAGFAVVADEVRNLAMRAAESARNTSVLIEETTRKVREGSGLVTSTNSAFLKVAEGSGKVGELVSEIAAASDEQAKGIDQINRAVNEMDRNTQQNAASSEEFASVSEEMSAQAQQMGSMIRELVGLIEGK
jgi:methyl-accepting chemotaxis protein